MNTNSDPLRQPTKIALSAGRYFQSANTRFVHYCYETSEFKHDTIPVVDNFLWVLTLLRTHHSDQIKEGFVLLERLLFYSQNGNFPRYLHEAPDCRDGFLAVHLLAPFYRLVNGYKKIMPQYLAEKFEKVVLETASYCIDLYESQGAPYHLAVKIGAGVAALGFDKGWEILDKCQEQDVVESWFSPDHIGDLLVSLSMVYDDLEKSPWSAFWEHVNQTWYRPTLSYIGPALRQRQRREEPQATVYDLFLSALDGRYSSRALQVHPYQLQAALLFPSENRLAEIKVPASFSGNYQGRPWNVLHFSDFGYGFMQLDHPLDRSQQYRHVPFQLHWGCENRVHSLCLQGGNLEKLHLLKESEGTILMKADVNHLEDSEKDLAFYIDSQEALNKTIKGKAATTFELGEEVVFKDQFLKFGVLITCNDLKGRYLGHLRPGMRPSQMCKKGEDRFASFDEEVMLRNIERNGAERIDIQIRIES